MNKIKEWLKIKLKNFLLKVLNDEITDLKLYGVKPWYQENLWEPPVQIALRDLCNSGDIVFDVGANFAGLTMIMSRMVGLKGIVCAFEASPRIIDKCQRNLVLNGCNNVQLYHGAIYSQSYQEIPIYLGSHLNDSIYTFNEEKTPAYKVPSIALDDFISKTGLIPNLIKMDIEDAEFDAVKGLLNTIETAKPHLILETQPNDTRCLDLLKSKGYICIDLNSYRIINSSQDYPQGVGLRNNLYIHQDRLSETIYQPPFHFQECMSLKSDSFEHKSSDLIELKQPIILEKGRYLIDVDFVAEGRDNEMMCGVKSDDKVIFRYHAYTNLLASSYRDWVINLDQKSTINLYFNFLNNTNDSTFLIKGANISKISNFDHINRHLFI